MAANPSRDIVFKKFGIPFSFIAKRMKRLIFATQSSS